MSEPKFTVGDMVYCLIGSYAHKARVSQLSDSRPYADYYEVEYPYGSGEFCEDFLFPTKEALLEHIRKQLEELE